VSVLIALAVPAFILLMVFEALLCRAHPDPRHRGYEARDTAASLAMGIGNVAMSALCKVAAAALAFGIYQYRLFDIGTGWLAWVVLIPLEDFTYYWFHRLSHEVRLLWAAHVNHHSSRHYNLSTALRQSWTTPLTGPWFWFPLAFIGFHPAMILTAQAISLIYQFWIHTERIGRLGPLEWVMNTPSHHRVHHGRNVEYLDRNYAGIFIVWDRLFGTFEPEGAPVDYGITKNLDTFDPRVIAFHEWIAMFRDAWHAPRLRDALRYLVLPPGWSPDGSSHTARELQRLSLRCSSST